MWLLMAVLSAVFAGATSILAKCGIRKTDSDIATALRTVVVLLFSWIMVFVVGSAPSISSITPESMLFLVLSGLATGASWICYFRALSLGDVNKVVPIDKSSTVLTVLLAILLFQETSHLAVKLTGTVLLAAGIYLMVEKKASRRPPDSSTHPENRSDPVPRTTTPAHGQGSPHPVSHRQDSRWVLYAVLSAVFASLTSILAKVGITDVESNLGTALRTGVVLVMAWLIVFMKGKQSQLKDLRAREFLRGEPLFICLSGLATGASWLCYYYAIQNGPVSVVVPIDKLSILVTILFSRIVFHETLSKKALTGLLLMVLGTLAMAL